MLNYDFTSTRSNYMFTYIEYFYVKIQLEYLFFMIYIPKKKRSLTVFSIHSKLSPYLNQLNI